MTLPKLLLIISVIAIILTLIIGLVFKKKKNWIMSFLQNFVGTLLIISGIVKAVDPLGTAYKMTDYLGEFQNAFEGSFLKPIAGIFPFLNNYVISLAVIMIVFEILIGIMLILGHRSKLTAWLYLTMMGAFTVMTGFTYLTGYVPEGVNFFEFSKWGPYLSSNMKVTDCGCFGDFMKLKPIVTFSKDVVLLMPGLFFLFKSKIQHKLFSQSIRDIISIVSIIGLTLYCFTNFVWDIPKTDFRPFKKGVNLLAQKELEEDAMANIAILSWTLKNRKTSEIKKLPNATYMKNYKSYPKTEWEIVDQEKTEPAIKSTKISEFELDDHTNGEDVAAEILGNTEPNLMIVCYKLKGEGVTKQRKKMDSIFVNESISLKNRQDSTIRRFKGIEEVTEDYVDYKWDEDYVQRFIDKIKPLAKAAEADGKKIYLVTGSTADMVQSLFRASGLDIDYYTADDILLKTIVRSNPGIVLLKSSTILDKWHYNKLPSYSDIKSEHGF